MDSAHIHLVITHLPIFGSLLGALVLFYGMVRRQADVLVAAYGLMVLSAVGAGIAYATGEGAEERVEHLSGVSENLIEIHEDAALWALVAMIVLGVIALAALAVIRRNSPYASNWPTLVLTISLISFVLIGRAGYLGGQIRHTELGAMQTEANGPTNDEAADDDD